MNSDTMQLWEIVDPFFNNTINPNYLFQAAPNSPNNYSNIEMELVKKNSTSQDHVFAGLTDNQCCPSLQYYVPNNDLQESSCSSKKKSTEECLSGEIDHEKPSKKKHDHKPKRTRSNEMHNMYERRRRDRIKGKMKALQDLIPYNHKADKASILDDTIDYLKELKMKIEVLESSLMGGAAMWQATGMSPAGSGIGIPSGQYVPMNQFASRLPTLPSPSPLLSTAAAAGMQQISSHGNPLPVPFINLPTSTTFSSFPSFGNGLFGALNFPNQGDFSSQTVATTKFP